jgi:signal peptidase I
MLTAACVIVGAIALVAVPRYLGWQGVVVLSGSMEPALRTGGLAFMDTTIDADSLERGDVISFRGHGETMLTHRIVDVKLLPQGRRYEKRGDANKSVDAQLVTPSQVTGRLVFALPYAGRWSQWLQSQGNYKLFIWPIAGLVIVSELWNIAGQLRRRADDTSMPPPARTPGSPASHRVRINLLETIPSSQQAGADTRGTSAE